MDRTIRFMHLAPRLSGVLVRWYPCASRADHSGGVRS